jgi:L-fuconolactonase
MIASLHAPPAWHRAVGDLAERHPAVPVLLHHQGLAADPEAADGLMALASVPNAYVKASGFHYLVSRPWSYPFAEARPGFRRLVEEFGADRMLWGSDYPVCAKYGIGYRQSLEVVRTECDFLDERELDAILGGTAAALLGRTAHA